MERRVPITRKRRKRAHPTKCPCCSEERGKPEKEPRRKKREIISAEVVDEQVNSERLMEHGCEPKSKKIDSESMMDEEGNDVGRVLRSGQSTPVSFEFELSKDKTISQLDDTSEVNKKRLQNVGKKGKPTNKICEQSTVYNSSTMCTTVGLKPVSEIPTVKVPSVKPSRKRRKPADNLETKGNKKKAPKKKLLKKTLRTGNRAPTTKKKALATEKLKIRSFDTLKGKLEKAFGKTNISVPKCMELLGKITATHFKDILRDDILEGSGSDRDLTEEKKESSSETKTIEGMSERTIESEAAKTLVSFKVQTTTSSGNSLCDQPSLSVQPSSKEELQSFLKSYNLQTTYSNKSSTGGIPLFASPQPLVTASPFPIGAPIANGTPYTGNSAPYSVLPASMTPSSSTVTCSSLLPYASTKPLGGTALSTIVASSTGAKQVLPSIGQAFKKAEVQAVSAAPVASPNVSIVQSPVAFQLSFQVSGNSSSPSQTGPSNHIQQSPGFIYKKPILNTLLPTNTAKQTPNTLLPCPRLVYVTNVLPTDKNTQLKPHFPGFPSGMKTEEQVFSASTFPTATASSTPTPTNLVCSVTPCSVSTSVTEVQSCNKLRPILPREPFVAPTLVPVFGAGVPQSLQQFAEQSNQPVKKLVGDRVNDSLEVVTSLPDMASAFGNTTTIINAIPGSSSLAVHDGNFCGKQEHEMRSKEQAIKALLSIGGNSSVLNSPRKMEGLGNRPYDSDVSSELKVVFETDKGIFKVDDVTIDPQVNTLGKESYTCGKCGKIFTSLSYLARHIKRVCPDMTHRKWKCNHCDKAFRHPFGLQQHVYTHTGERPHKCPQCPKAFYSSNDLRRHSRIHSGERPYICKHCGKSFATTISLKTHTFIHTGEKPHRCPHCTKTFATSSKLGRHIVTHSEQRPYPCQKCPKTFNRSGDLRRHDLHVHDAKFIENVAAPEMIYKCTECMSSFETTQQLGEHINEHTTDNGLNN